MNNQTAINCPNCSLQIDVNDVLYNQLERKYKNTYLTQKKANEDKTNDVKYEIIEYILQNPRHLHR